MLQLLAGKSNVSHSPARHPVRCLVLVPTRELAAQVQESVRTYGKHMKLRTAVVYGGVGFEPQVQELRRGVDIVVHPPRAGVAAREAAKPALLGDFSRRSAKALRGLHA